MNPRWFVSKTVRQATDLWRHVRKLLNSQRDLLAQPAIDATEASLADLRGAIEANAEKPVLEKKMADLEKTANKWLKPYPNAAWRENVEVLLVAIAVAMGIRTFFLQPFKIPTGSMQPTLYGVEYEAVEKIPAAPQRFIDACVEGAFYHHLVAKQDGRVIGLEPQHVLRFINKLIITLEYASGQQERVPLWFGPDDEKKFAYRTGLLPGRTFHQGEDIVRVKEISGDHLFVDRMTYNFRHPRRGEIIVFKTRGIEHESMPQDQFYIKRLVALGGEKVRIGNDRHLIIDGRRLDASTPHFENVYHFGALPMENHYSGHVNQAVANQVDPRLGLAPLFASESSPPFEVRPYHYMVMGDNTMNSSDSRTWGDFPAENVIGKSYFVYWPISNHGESRFGWGYR